LHTVESPYQAGQTEIRVLLPERLAQGRRYPVVYVLPVETHNESQYGSGLLEVKRHNLHKKYQVIFVAPTFSHCPWYADHPTDPWIRQETYFLKVVVPFIESRYPAQAKATVRLLLGFSKSGWGAFSLLLRHPNVFGKAAAWDAPLMKDKPNQFAMGDIFGTQENFEKYQITKLLEQRAVELRGQNRLILTGYGNFRQQHQRSHDLMTKLRIPHEYRDGPKRKHGWDSGWVEEAVGLLLENKPDNR
jgi:S-formylglutathione hydrolase FrmB